MDEKVALVFVQCPNDEDHGAHNWQREEPGSSVLLCTGKLKRSALLDDLAVLKLHLEDDLINDTQAGEAFARVVGALDLSPAEEDWLEQQ